MFSVSDTGASDNKGSSNNPVRKMRGKKILVHICCGPCSIYPLKQVMGREAEVWGFFHNPNIHPYAEFKKRLDAVKTLAGLLRINVIYDEAYRPTSFIKGVKELTGAGGPGAPKKPPFGERCVYCYSTRLEATARAAREGGFDAFSTSLLYSRYQNHDDLVRSGYGLARKYGVEFIYRDFREGWFEGIEESRKMGLYRQKYCGCIYSRIERTEEKRLKKKLKAEKKFLVENTSR